MLCYCITDLEWEIVNTDAELEKAQAELERLQTYKVTIIHAHVRVYIL